MLVDPGELNSTRADLAIERMRNGEPIQIGNLSIRPRRGAVVSVTVWTQWVPENAPAGSHEADALEGARSYAALNHRWPALREAVGDATIEIELHYDYGGGAIRLGRLVDGSYRPSP